MQYSPKLKKVALKIKELLKEYDVAGFVVLHTPGNAEFIMHLTPSYSCVVVDEEKVRVRARLMEDFAGNKELMEKKVAATSQMLNTMATTGGQQYLTIMQLSDILDKAVEAKHTDEGFTSHNTQNN